MTGEVEDKIKQIATNIRRIRESKGYTQEYIALKLGISQNAYSKIELGYTKITLERLFQIADVLEITVAELLDTDDEPELRLLQTGTN